MIQSLMLALASSEALINTMFFMIRVGLVFWLLFWLIGFVELPEPFSKVCKVILAVAAVLVLINIIMSMVGHPIYRW